MGLVGFECPLRGEKKLFFKLENFDSGVRVNINLKPCICLKSENANIENESTTGRNIFEF